MARKLAGEWLRIWSNTRAAAMLELGYEPRTVCLLAKLTDITATTLHRDPPSVLREDAERLRMSAPFHARPLASNNPERARSMLKSRTDLALAAIFDLAASEAEERLL